MCFARKTRPDGHAVKQVVRENFCMGAYWILLFMFSCAKLFACLICLHSIASFAIGGETRRHALLIGCSEYTNLESRFQLQGPANDVRLMRQLLIDRFEFDPKRDDMITLSASEDGDHLPTRTHIEREFQRLAAEVQAGEFVVILMGGHGSQQPNLDANDFEEDGLDETFLASDAGRWNGKIGSVENAISDDEIRLWLAPMVRRGAFVWLIADFCHSGSGMRGNDGEISRQVPLEQLIPKDALAESMAATGSQPKSVNSDAPFDIQGNGGLVAIYASQSHETTPECMLPSNAASNKRAYYGLLTYTLCEILSQTSRQLTYNELAQAIQTRYITLGRRSPTPLIEGSHRDRLVLGQETFPDRSKIVLDSKSRDTLKINAGGLQGITPGSILAVFTPTGAAKELTKPIGHVLVTNVELAEATVEPCRYKNFAAETNLPNRGRCEVVYQGMAPPQIRVAIAAHTVAGDEISEKLRKKLTAELRNEASKFVSVSESSEDAEWMLRFDNGQLRWLPRSGLSDRDQAGHEQALPSVAMGPGWPKELVAQIEKIARAQNLLRLVNLQLGSTSSTELGFDMSIVDGDNQRAIERSASGYSMRDGQKVTVQLKNAGRHSIDVTLLYVDSDYGIKCLYPKLGEMNRLGTGEKNPVRLTIDAKTTGIENLVAIVVKGSGQPVDFSLLAQPSLSQARSRGFGDSAMDSPLGQFCRMSMYGEGGTRGIDRSLESNYVVDVRTWRIEPNKR